MDNKKLTVEDYKKALSENYGFDEDELNSIIFFENYDYVDAIIGFSEETLQVIYDYDLMVESLVTNEAMSYDEAVEWIDYNTLRALPYAYGLSAGAKPPIIKNAFIV